MSRRTSTDPTPDKSTRWGRLPQAQQEAGGVGARTLWRWASIGQVRVSRVGRITLFDLDSIRSLIEKNASGGQA